MPRVNYLMKTQRQKPIRVLAVWSKKLEALGLWYDQLLAESLGKQGHGSDAAHDGANPRPALARPATPGRDPRQAHQQPGRQDARHPPIMIGMMDRNEDDLNQFNRKGYPDFLDAALRGTNQA